MTAHTSRRALFGFAGLAGVAAAMPAIVVASMRPAPTGVYAAYLAAEARFKDLPGDLELVDEVAFRREEAAYHAAWDAINDSTPATQAEFIAWLQATSDGSVLAMRTLAIARDIAAKEGR
jgi:hypothetical protein